MNDHSQPAGASPTAAKSPAGLADAIRDQATGYVDRRKGEAAGFLADLAKALRGDTERIDDGAQVKSFVHAVADGLDDLSGNIDRRGLHELYRDAKLVVRRYPTASMAVALAAGYGIFHLQRASRTGDPGPTAERPGEPWGGYP
ncbi:hypothetical protein MKK63_08590 [Methylobacterium sp. J-088]|uniref:hypothetical protein n=1 Tax=Methylobacterium sp. J-088 TaxID=2836664 RepID=UPI001FBAA461|nr:hypothetical protein [Methylobacterium sp. J-088]MCJ2062764.1 hypothetical protein [Methylobacterium sp. J-088]